ncbi:hypothetical protein [Corynebacterium variabile]|uniref:hypothetical protein n=1 Tax=Corynebacterium variabile TaxID=1727 RepID=UPI003BB0AF1D
MPPKVQCEMQGFTKGRFSSVENVSVSLVDILSCAATVGMPTIASTPTNTRPLTELIWRMGIVSSNIKQTPHGFRWTRSSAYDRLDPSEKTAVSYFLGMTMAAIACKKLFRYQYIIHVDAILQSKNLPLKGKRPDFIGIDIFGHQSGLIEAKGRSNGFDQGALDKAKVQVGYTPAISSLGVNERIASEAYFDENNHWSAVIADPTGNDSTINITIEELLVIYYDNIVNAGRATGTWRQRGNNFTFRPPESSIEISIPKVIVDAYDQSTKSLKNPEGDHAQLEGSPLFDAVRELSESTEGKRSDFIKTSLIELDEKEYMNTFFEKPDKKSSKVENLAASILDSLSALNIEHGDNFASTVNESSTIIELQVHGINSTVSLYRSKQEAKERVELLDDGENVILVGDRWIWQISPKVAKMIGPDNLQSLSDSLDSKPHNLQN